MAKHRRPYSLFREPHVLWSLLSPTETSHCANVNVAALRRKDGTFRLFLSLMKKRAVVNVLGKFFYRWGAVHFDFFLYIERKLSGQKLIVFPILKKRK